MAKKNKFHAVQAKCRYCEKKHDSKKEARRCNELHRMQADGLIVDLEVQPTIQLVPAQRYGGADARMCDERALTYRADFRYTEKSTGCMVVEDVKGLKTDAYKIKRKIVKYLFCRKGEVVFLET